MKPSPEQIIVPSDLVHASAAWMAAAQAEQLLRPLLNLRADIQAVKRLIVRDGCTSPDLNATLGHVEAGSDELLEIMTRWRDRAPGATARARLQPEREIAAALSLLAWPGVHLDVRSKALAPRVTGRPGLVSVGTLHFLLALDAATVSVVRVDRPQPATLLLVAPGASIADAGAGRAMHSAAAAVVTESLGGHLDLLADGGPRLVIPLEL